MSLLPKPEQPEPVTCENCGEDFRHPRDLALHRGRRHETELTEPQRAQFELALEEERRWLARFRRHVRSGLVTLPILLVYGVVVVAGFAYRARPTFLLLPLPGILGFAGLTYYLSFRHQSGD